MVLLDATVNDKPAVLLLDTGSDFTLISPQASGMSTAKLRALTATKTTGANGEYVKARVRWLFGRLRRRFSHVSLANST